MTIIFFSHPFFYSCRIGGAITNRISLDALQSISMEDTVHDMVDPEPMKPPRVPEKIHVQSEDDIIGQRASITDHVCLEQLAEYLVLPIPLCTVKDPLTSVECQAPEPFKIQTQSKEQLSSYNRYVQTMQGSLVFNLLLLCVVKNVTLTM